MHTDAHGDTASKIISFLREIGIEVRYAKVDATTFLPGIAVDAGGLVVDETLLKYPGDLLHEAGHLAVTRGEIRPTLAGEVESPDAEPHVTELEAMLWSYAACLHLGLDPRVVFHRDGYHGQSESLLINFEMGVFLGVQGLEAAGMTLSQAEAARLGRAPFPIMKKWLKD